MEVDQPGQSVAAVLTPAAAVGKCAANSRSALPSKDRYIQDVQVLHRNLREEDFVFDLDGINILVGEGENGMRKGWKMEARTWRWATEVPQLV
ncbi:hypothetical protein NM688_g2908 [Phlebia brevispora]|uniref:Uncharacterized protein n=1 Tax=Phlebia brevispora TaxID=194682 RepID=A0ACC1T763_9APHY|nr:hypothetical protein NM688_g2908 [Phlebia brevispora]